MTGNDINEGLHKKLKKVNIVYGINTEVGKTHTTQELLKEINGKIKKNFVIKPVISGFVSSEYHLSDNYKLLKASGVEKPTMQEILSL
jgi:dethiobiotin synthetase